MFKHQIKPFGKYTKHCLSNPNGTSLSLVPEYGACLLDLSFNGSSVLDAYKTPEELDFNRWSKNIVLYPFPNRLKNGQYQWKGKSYQFPINDSHTGNALHGFGFNQNMAVEKVVLEERSASILLRSEYNGDNPAFPFSFTFHIEFYLNSSNNFEAGMRFQNTGVESMPIGWGWHPYFQLADTVENLELQTPELHMIGIDQTMIPTGKRYTYNDFAFSKSIGTTVLDNCFATDDEEQVSILLKGEKGTLNYWQECGQRKYNFIQLFTPPHRKSLAIEPMTCNVDAFNNGDGLIELVGGETTEAKFGLSYTPNF